MKHIKKCISVSLVIALLFSLFPMSVFGEKNIVMENVGNSQTGIKNYLIKFKDPETGINKLKGKPAKFFKHLPNVAAVQLTEDEHLELQIDTGIEYLEPDAVIQTSELNTVGQAGETAIMDQVTENLKQIHIPEVHEQGIYGSGVKVAVLDTGIDIESNDLRIAGGVSFVQEEETIDDLNGHGTGVAGVIAALKNNKGLIGVSPEVELYNVKVLNSSGIGSYSQVIEGIEWAIDNRMDIVSMSFEGKEDSDAMKEVMDTAYQNGILLIAPTGNDGTNTVAYPARLKSLIAVGAVDESNQLASFSNTGEKVELVAPGVNIQALGLDNTNVQISGTSIAVPQVTGIAALIKEQNPSLSNKEIQKVLVENAVSLGDRTQYGYGLVNGLGALAESNLINTKDELQSLGRFKKNEVEQIKKHYTPVMLEIASYFYPELNALLSEQELKTMLSLDETIIEHHLDNLTKEQLNWMQKLTPITVDQYKERKLPKKKEANTIVTTASTDPYKYNEKSNQFHYDQNIDDDVDIQNRTANQSDIDLYLPGRNGLDINLIRNYNSFNSKITTPIFICSTFYNPGDCGLKGSSDYHPTMPQWDLYFNHFEYSRNVVPRDINTYYVAQGWELSIIPTVQVGSRFQEEQFSTKWLNSYTTPVIDQHYLFTNSQKSSNFFFTLEDGKTYEFGSAGSRSTNHPEENVTYSRNSGCIFLNVNDQYTYCFSEATYNIVWKQNRHGDTIGYSFADEYYPNDVTVTDTIGRTIFIDREYGKVKGIVVKDRNGTLTHQIQYNTEQRSSSITARFGTCEGSGCGPYYNNHQIDISWDQLNSVVDVIANRTLKTYTYYEPTPQRKSDFNFEDDWMYYLDNNNLPLLDIKDSNGNGIESSEVVKRDLSTYAETVYLLLNEVTDDTGFTTQYQYQSYDTNWQSYSNFIERDTKRGSVRLYKDKFGLKYIGFLPVTNVYYKYTNSFGEQKILQTDITTDLNCAQEIWMRPKKGGQFGDFRLSNASSYRSGDTPVTTITKHIGNSILKSTNAYKAVDGGLLLLDYSTNETGTISNNIDSTDESNRYKFSSNVRIGYQYDTGKSKPYLTKQFDYGDTNDTKPADIKAFLMTGNNRTLPTNLSKYSTLNKTEYDSYGFITYQEDSYGNKTEIAYNGPKHMVSSVKKTSADGLTIHEQLTAYNQDNTYTISTITVNSSYPDPLFPLDPTKVKKDTTVTSFTGYSYLTRYKPTHIRETSSGSQFGNQPIIKDTDLQYDAKYLHVIKETTQVTLVNGQPSVPIEVSYSYDNRDRLQTQTFNDGSKVGYTYDLKDRMLTETFTPSQSNTGPARTITYSYDDVRRVVVTTSPDGEKLITTYTPYGEVEKQQRQVGTSTVTTLINKMDSTGFLKVETDPYGDVTKKTTFQYGNNGQIQTISDALGQQTNYYYANTAYKLDGSSTYVQETVRVLEPNAKETWMYKDRTGRELKTVEKSPTKNRTTQFTYTALGQVSQKQVSTSNGTQTTQYGYDAMGNLIYVKDDKNQEYQYLYNRLGQVIAIYINGKLQRSNLYNEVGWLLTKTNAADQQEKYQYKNNSLVDKFIDKDDQQYTYTYTPYNEQDRVSIKNAGGAEVFWQKNTYDSSTRLLTGITNSENEALVYHFDSWKRMDQQTVVGKSYTFGYDSFDRLSSLTYPDGSSVSYTYDNINRPTTVSYPGMGIVNYSYTVGNNENVYKISYPNGVVQEKRTDAFNDLLSVQQKNNAVVEWNETYGYDGFGNITSIDRNEQSLAYTYDGLNRVKGEATQQKSYSYDDQGNISQFLQNGQTYSYTYDSTNRTKQAILPTGTFNYTYDARGNRLTANSNSFTYNALNQLKTFNKTGVNATYTYYGDGLRATKTINGNQTRYVYLNGKVIEELDSDGTTKARNIWGNELLYRKDVSGNKSGYYTYNGHGDVVKITDEAGAVLNSYDYDIWGNITSKSESMSNSFKYTGEIYDDETGLIYLRARYYDPTIGRFITEDTYEGEFSNPLSANLYTYVENNPLRYTDPTGHQAAEGAGSIGSSGNVKWKNSSVLTPDEIMNIIENPNSTDIQKARAITAIWKNIIAPDKGGAFLINETSKFAKYIKEFKNLFSFNKTKTGSLIIENGGKFSESEISAAKYLQSLGNDVLLRIPRGTRAGGGTSDLLVNGVSYDVYTPITNNPNRIFTGIADKKDQASGIVLDLSQTSVTAEQLGDIMARLRGKGITTIKDIIILK